MFQNISDFNDTSDYLPIFNASLIADIVIIFMLYYTNIFGDPKKLKLWYEKYRLSAVIADVFILIIGMILGRFFYYKVFEEYSFTKFVFLILAIQIIHDYLFYKFFSAVPRGTNNMLDLFKDYESKPIKRKALKIEATFNLIYMEEKSEASISILQGILTFKCYQEPQIGDYICYLNEEDVYHISKEVFLDRNIVED